MGSDGRACISSMATLLFGSSLACVQTTPMASSRSAFASADIAARGCDECVWAREFAEINKTRRKHFTQRRKTAENPLCVFASLREVFFICAAKLPSASPETLSHPRSRLQSSSTRADKHSPARSTGRRSIFRVRGRATVSQMPATSPKVPSTSPAPQAVSVQDERRAPRGCTNPAAQPDPTAPSPASSSIERELLLPRPIVDDGRLIFLQQDEVLENQRVHVGAHEAAVRILGRADDRLASHVERRVDDDRAAGFPVERVDDVVVERVRFTADRLDSRGIIDVRDRGDRRSRKDTTVDTPEVLRVFADRQAPPPVGRANGRTP